MEPQDWQAVLAIARSVGWGAADILRDAAQGGVEILESEGDPVTAADIDTNTYILSELRSQMPHSPLAPYSVAYLTEETFKTHPDDRRLTADYVWIIDPLDGTKEFIRQTGEYAVHIALVHQQRPVLAVVVRPALPQLYFALRGEGSFVETPAGTIAPLHVSNRSAFDEMVVVTSRSHRSDRLNQLMHDFPCQRQISVGSLGGKFAAIADQQADIYVSLSGTSAPKDWDLAAPELILTEAGGQFTHFDGTPLHYNQADVSQWGGLLASNGRRHADLCAAATEILSLIDE